MNMFNHFTLYSTVLFKEFIYGNTFAAAQSVVSVITDEFDLCPGTDVKVLVVIVEIEHALAQAVVRQGAQEGPFQGPCHIFCVQLWDLQDNHCHECCYA